MVAAVPLMEKRHAIEIVDVEQMKRIVLSIPCHDVYAYDGDLCDVYFVVCGNQYEF